MVFPAVVIVAVSEAPPVGMACAAGIMLNAPAIIAAKIPKRALRDKFSVLFMFLHSFQAIPRIKTFL
jgi:hypothetical protein